VTQLLCRLCVPLLLLFVAVPLDAQTREPASQPSLVVTSGAGIVQTVPDRAFITITADSRAASPREAQQKNSEVMKPVIDKLRGAGLPPEAIKTVFYDLQREWDYRDNRRIPRGYLARNTIEVRVDAIEKVGELLDLAVTTGATSVGDIRFDLKDRSKLEREALRLAVADARERAQAAASGAGLSIARIVRIEEHGVMVPPPPPMPMMREAMMAKDEASQAVPVSTGQMELRVRVTLTSELK
jgi:uncharacterized protein YggE